MSMLNPWIARDPIRYSTNPFSLMDQNFGLGMLSEDLHFPTMHFPSITSSYMRPWRFLPGRQSGTSNIVMDGDQFRVNLDVQQFRPDEVSVKVVDNFIVVEGNHEERSDEHGYISRTFRRRYQIPRGVDAEAITSNLSSDGVLTVAAPAKKPAEMLEENERKIPITQTMKPASIMRGPGAQEQNTGDSIDGPQAGEAKN